MKKEEEGKTLEMELEVVDIILAGCSINYPENMIPDTG